MKPNIVCEDNTKDIIDEDELEDLRRYKRMYLCMFDKILDFENSIKHIRLQVHNLENISLKMISDINQSCVETENIFLENPKPFLKVVK